VLPRAELPEILHCARADVSEELNFNASCVHTTDSNIKKDHWIAAGDRFNDRWVHGPVTRGLNLLCDVNNNTARVE
jgi:hypothetical protein